MRPILLAAVVLAATPSFADERPGNEASRKLRDDGYAAGKGGDLKKAAELFGEAEGAAREVLIPH